MFFIGMPVVKAGRAQALMRMGGGGAFWRPGAGSHATGGNCRPRICDRSAHRAEQRGILVR